MNARSSRLPQLLAISLAVAAIAGGLAFAQAVKDQPAPAGEPQAPVEATSAPAQETATTQPAECESPVRSRLLSGLVGSKHDFTRLPGGGRDLCLPCHTPHQAFSQPPLLDRRAAAILPLRPYLTPEFQLSGWSLLCLGCHDGVTAPDVYSSPHATTVAAQIDAARFGTRGLRSHPIGIKLPEGAETYNSPEWVEAGGLPLADGRIQCTTCHDAHNTERHSHMLRISNQGSRLCLTCHRL
jgi:predicted CXXCH cytochrome family protein